MLSNKLFQFYYLIFQFLYEREWPDRFELLKILAKEVLDVLFPEISDDERIIESSEFEAWEKEFGQLTE